MLLSNWNSLHQPVRQGFQPRKSRVKYRFDCWSRHCEGHITQEYQREAEGSVCRLNSFLLSYLNLLCIHAPCAYRPQLKLFPSFLSKETVAESDSRDCDYANEKPVAFLSQTNLCLSSASLQTGFQVYQWCWCSPGQGSASGRTWTCQGKKTSGWETEEESMEILNGWEQLQGKKQDQTWG